MSYNTDRLLIPRQLASQLVADALLDAGGERIIWVALAMRTLPVHFLMSEKNLEELIDTQRKTVLGSTSPTTKGFPETRGTVYHTQPNISLLEAIKVRNLQTIVF